MNIKKNLLCGLILTVSIGGAWGNLVSDGQFLSEIKSYPDADSAPWYTMHENGAWSVEMDDSRSCDAGGKSLKINTWRGGVNIAQDTGKQIEYGYDYCVSLQMMTDDPSTNPTHKASPGIWVTISTAKEVEGPYTYRKQFFWETTTTEHGEWEIQDGVIPARDLIPFLGEYIQIRIVKPSENTTHAIWVDDVQLSRRDTGERLADRIGALIY